MRLVPSLDVRVRRVYDEPSAADGARVLVDRVWPRGLRKDALRLDDWAKDVAPSTELRTWYGHDPAKFGEFRQRYLGELAASPRQAALGQLRTLAGSGRPLTLLTATKDVEHSQAAVLPMCSSASNTPSEIRSARAAAARTGQASSYSTTSITERSPSCPPQTNAPRPVMARPTISVLISRVPS